MKTIFSYLIFALVLYCVIVSIPNVNTLQAKIKLDYKSCIRKAVIKCEIKNKYYRRKLINKCKILAYHNQDISQIKNSISCKRK